MKISCIYRIVSKINPDKIYVGSAISFYIRKRSHLNELKKNKHGNKILQNHYNKYGADDFIFEIIERVHSQDKLLDREQHYIDQYNPIFNISKKARRVSGIKFGSDTRKKMSLAHKGKKFSEEHKSNLSKLNKGRIHSKEIRERMSIARKNKAPIKEETRLKLSQANKGRKHSDEAKSKISKWFKGRPRTEETIKKMRASMIGFKHSEETKIKIGLSGIGRKHSKESIVRMLETRKGYKHSQEIKNKMKEAFRNRPNKKRGPYLKTRLKQSAE